MVRPSGSNNFAGILKMFRFVSSSPLTKLAIWDNFKTILSSFKYQFNPRILCSFPGSISLKPPKEIFAYDFSSSVDDASSVDIVLL